MRERDSKMFCNVSCRDLGTSMWEFLFDDRRLLRSCKLAIHRVAPITWKHFQVFRVGPARRGMRERDPNMFCNVSCKIWVLACGSFCLTTDGF